MTYCSNCKKDTENVIQKTRYGRTWLLSKCAVCGNKKSRFIKKQRATVLLTSLGLKTPLNQIPLLGDIIIRFDWKNRVKEIKLVKLPAIEYMTVIKED